MTEILVEGLTWNSFAYLSEDEVDGLTGPDQHTRCESPRHKFGEVKPPAAWVEMLWYPKRGFTAARCWKTCEDCHVAMVRSAEKVPE